MIKKRANIVFPVGYLVLLSAAIFDQSRWDYRTGMISIQFMLFLVPIVAIYVLVVRVLPLRFLIFMQSIFWILLVSVNLFIARMHLNSVGLAAGNRQSNPFAFLLSIYTVFFIFFILKQKKKDIYSYLTVPVLFVTTIILFFLSW